MTDGRIVELYGLWSEETYCAGFTSPSPDAVRQFREWLVREPKWDSASADAYEVKMIAEFRQQEMAEFTPPICRCAIQNGNCELHSGPGLFKMSGGN